MLRTRRALLLAVLLSSFASIGGHCADPAALIVQPVDQQLSEPGDLDVFFYLLPPLQQGSVLVEVVSDAGVSDVTAQLDNFGRFFWGSVNVATLGEHEIRVSATGPSGPGESANDFEIVDLPDADVCEVLNPPSACCRSPRTASSSRIPPSPTACRWCCRPSPWRPARR